MGRSPKQDKQITQESENHSGSILLKALSFSIPKWLEEDLAKRHGLPVSASIIQKNQNAAHQTISTNDPRNLVGECCWFFLHLRAPSLGPPTKTRFRPISISLAPFYSTLCTHPTRVAPLPPTKPSPLYPQRNPTAQKCIN